MRKKKMNVLHGLGIGAALGAAAGIAGGMMMGGGRQKMKKTAAKAFKAVGDVIENVQGMMGK